MFGAKVEAGRVDRRVSNPIIATPWLTADASEAVLEIPGAARFHVWQGRHVQVQVMPGASASVIRMWLEGMVASLVLIQQRRFALHASTIRVGGRLVAVAGPSGAGKSTTAALLAGRGHSIVTDEVTAVDFAVREGVVIPTVCPSGRRLRLRRETVERLGMSRDGGEEIIGTGKLGFPLVPTDHDELSLELVVVLRPEGGEVVSDVHALTGPAALTALITNTLRPYFCILQHQAHLRWIAGLASAVPIVQLDRPSNRWTGSRVAMLIEEAAMGGRDTDGLRPRHAAESNSTPRADLPVAPLTPSSAG
ncbi:hypothetical protein O3597_16610 [Verrucosispora sp. WMMA2044]|uniref:Serine kinase n=1 Tax=Verrucosispora sioxanthis TaxID=2499994 RepID=A0A6M1L4Q4_9ACTN|nr:MULTISPECIES: hypothetical protein [Micromonospora]NEE62454.1 hypothetical protein [Verrucosispora sioxanthis]NGM11564.1 hypothetical protein [Verrucosispora sioxanthis]WBB46807.1 hypothetical protein O3597_16610 [Verrucosispora sp. WMMA2044]